MHMVDFEGCHTNNNVTLHGPVVHLGQSEQKLHLLRHQCLVDPYLPNGAILRDQSGLDSTGSIRSDLLPLVYDSHRVPWDIFVN